MTTQPYSNKPTPTSYLITHIKLATTLSGAPVINFYSPPLQHAVLQLFDFSLLFTADIDPNKLEPGIEHHCRFIAHYQVSDKQKSTGNPYLNIIRLEPIYPDRPNPALGELRAIKALIRHLINLTGVSSNGNGRSDQSQSDHPERQPKVTGQSDDPPNQQSPKPTQTSTIPPLIPHSEFRIPNSKTNFIQTAFTHFQEAGFYTEQDHIAKTIPYISPDWQPDGTLADGTLADDHPTNKAMLAALDTYQEKRLRATKLKIPHAEAHTAAISEARGVYQRMLREEVEVE